MVSTSAIVIYKILRIVVYHVVKILCIDMER